MSTTPSPVAERSDLIAAISRDHPGWHIWLGRSGRRSAGWYATRLRRLSTQKRDAGLLPMLAADDAEHLRQQLMQQHDIETSEEAGQ